MLILICFKEFHICEANRGFHEYLHDVIETRKGVNMNEMPEDDVWRKDTILKLDSSVFHLTSIYIQNHDKQLSSELLIYSHITLCAFMVNINRMFTEIKKLPKELKTSNAKILEIDQTFPNLNKLYSQKCMNKIKYMSNDEILQLLNEKYVEVSHYGLIIPNELIKSASGDQKA